ncbi:putative outer membrane protein PmpB precursor [Novipirellula aureliae]|uniref:Putative outer membrane protein PmpB n=1 Tax=Novipirellula aureliae TaxID=2527966 RepID=A0A5C6DBD3_9BACT|nr:dockerin type I domain-containing protein [Novipirellula aureliae]TWU34170.1 putative outer membrane protein PmpB precursor [Novipirellula aureliae]
MAFPSRRKFRSIRQSFFGSAKIEEQKSSKRRSFRARLEQLEDRRLLAVGALPLPAAPQVTDTTNIAIVAGLLQVSDTGDASDDDFLISYAGGVYTITDNNGAEIKTSIAGATGDGTDRVTIPDTGITGIEFNTLGGNDTLRIDQTGGNLAVPLAFLGGDDDDELILVGGTATDVTFSYDTENDGNIEIDGQFISYTGLEPITSTIDAVNIVLNYGAAEETITVSAAGVGQTNVDSDVGGETTTFNNPSGSLTINPQAEDEEGGDRIILGAVGSDFDADLSIHAGPDDAITIESPVADVGSGNVVLTAGNIQFTEGTIRTSGTVMISSPNIELTGTQFDDVLAITATSEDSGSFQLESNGLAGPSVEFIAASRLSFSGLDGDDILRISNPTEGLFRPDGGITFNGGDQTNADTLEVYGGIADHVEHVFANDSDGTIAYDGGTEPTILYDGLEPVIDTITASTRTFTFTGGAETITLGDGAAKADGLNQIDSTLGESVLFQSPTLTLQVNAGTGDDTIDVTALDSLYTASTILSGGSEIDTLTITGATFKTNDQGRGLELREMETATITTTTINDNTVDGPGAGLLVDAGDVTITDSSITGNVTTGGFDGGGIHQAAGTLSLDGTTIAENTAAGDGGGIFATVETLTVDTSTIQSNGADGFSGSGGGIYLGSGTLSIADTSISENRANRAGGGIEVVSATTTTLSNVDFLRNNAGVLPAVGNPGNGGALHVTGNGNVTIVDGSAEENTAASEGGAFWNGSGTMSIDGTTISSNTASGNAGDEGGGGVFNHAGTLTIENATFSGNQADGIAGSGGSIFSLAGTVTIDDSSIGTSSANRAGGGIEVVVGDVTLTNVDLFSNDVAGLGTTAIAPNPGNGGGLHISSNATVTLVGGLVRNNTARDEGGGLWNSATGTMTLTGTTVTLNTATGSNAANAAQGGGGLFNDGGLLTIQAGSIITENSALDPDGPTTNDDGGGGVFNNGGMLTITGGTTRITGNLATDGAGNGGGLLTIGGVVVITDATVSANSAARAGGGIENNAANLTLTNVIVGGGNLVDGNLAGVNGGGLHASGLAVTQVDGGTFTNNQAGEEGGGLWNGAGTMMVSGTMIDGNTASGTAAAQAGGGAFNSIGTLTLDGVTLTNNIANSDAASGGGAFNDQGTMHVLNSTIHGNDLCALAYLRPSGSIVDNDFGVNVGGNLCPLLGTDNDDIIRVTNKTITINADSLFYDDDTLGRIAIEAGLGNDQFEIRSTDADNPITADAGAGDDIVHISSDAPADAGTLDGILGDIDVIGGSHESTDEVTETVTSRRSPSENASVSTTTAIGDVMLISDDSDAGNNAYTLTSNTFQRTGPAATGVISYLTTETIDIETGNGNDVLSIASTAAESQATIRTSEGDDDVHVVRTGTDSILRLVTENGADHLTVETTGLRSVIDIDLGNQNDALTLLDRGTGSGINASTGAGSDTIVVGGAVASAPIVTHSTAVIAIQSAAGEDMFDVNEVFFETVVELSGGDDNDTFNLNAKGTDAAGFLGRINDDPIGSGGQDAQAKTRELLIDGGENGNATQTYIEGVIVTPDDIASETQVPNQDVGDTINVNAQSAAASLDLRYAITGASQGVLATTVPNAVQANRETIGNEVVDSLFVENINIHSGSADDILTVTSSIPYGIEQSHQAIRFDGDNGDSDRLEVLGTDQADRVTVGFINGDATNEPIEIHGVEYLRVDGLDDNDQISNQTDAISVLNGGEGMDTMLGGSAADALTGGPGVDNLFGRNGNDVLFSERDYGSDQNYITNGELLDGGGQDNLNPGDVCVQIGLDLVRNCEVLADGGAEKDVLTWLRARLIPGDSISFAGDSDQLEPFGPIQFPASELEATTEPSSLSDAAPSISNANPILAQGERIYDVNRDGLVTPLDAVIVINRMNDLETKGANAETELSISERLREDVDGDGKVSALDALLVINMLNEAAEPMRSAVESESTSVANASNHWAASVDQAFESANDWSDDDDANDPLGVGLLF